VVIGPGGWGGVAKLQPLTDRLAALLDAMPVEKRANLLRYVPASAQRISPANMLREPLETHHALRDFRPDPSGRKPSRALRGLADQMEREALVNQILRTFIDTSQVHFGFGVFLKHEVVRILEDLPDPQRAAILRELVTRGRPVRMGFVRRFQARYGLI
jgi:hypothetical protein